MTDGPRVHHLETIDDKGDQPSGGETTWTNTGATRSGSQRTAYDWLTWRRHAEAFAKPWDTMVQLPIILNDDDVIIGQRNSRLMIFKQCVASSLWFQFDCNTVTVNMIVNF